MGQNLSKSLFGALLFEKRVFKRCTYTSIICFCCLPMLISISVETEIVHWKCTLKLHGLIFGGGGGGGGWFAGYFTVSPIYQGLWGIWKYGGAEKIIY